MEQSPSWESNRFSASQRIPWILRNPNFQYRIQKRPPLFPILSQITSFHASPNHLLKIHFNIIIPYMPWSSKLYFSLRSPQNHVCTSYVFYTCPLPHLMLCHCSGTFLMHATLQLQLSPLVLNSQKTLKIIFRVNERYFDWKSNWNCTVHVRCLG